MKNLLKPVVLVGGLLSVLLIAIAQSSAAPSVGQPTALPRPTASLPPGTGIRLSTPTAVSPMLKGKRPPKCVFPLPSFTHRPEPPASSPSPEALTFSEPQVVLTSTTPLSLIDWLPDNETLLIKRRLPGSAKESIKTYNLRTGQSKTYGIQDSATDPLWIPNLKAVAYETLVMSSDGRDVDHEELWLSYGGSSAQHQLIATDKYMSEPALMGKKLVYFSAVSLTRPQVLDLETGHRPAFPVDLAYYFYVKYPQLSIFSRPDFSIAPHPQGPWDAYYGSGLLFLANRVTGEVCEVDLGSENELPIEAYYLQWSPDGRYLAMLTTTSFPGELIRQNALWVLDMFTGRMYKTDMGRFISRYKWAPESTFLLLTARVDVGDGRATAGLFLADPFRGKVRRIAPHHIFGGSDSMAVWRPDGKAIAVDCTWHDTLPAVGPGDKFRICVILVGNAPGGEK